MLLLFFLFTSIGLKAQKQDSLMHALSDTSLANSQEVLGNNSIETGIEKSHSIGSLLSELELEDSLKHLYQKIDLEKYDLPYKAFRYGMIGFLSLKQTGAPIHRNLISIIDFTKTSCEKRFYTIDLDSFTLKFHTYVSHGRNTGGNIASKFSNIPNSNQSSLGFYLTGETYRGKHGYSLRLDGMEEKYNSKARERAIVIHEAAYVSENWIQKYGRLGRSFGCPALPHELSKDIIDTIKDKTVIFAFYEDSKYLDASEYLDVSLILNKPDGD